MSLLRKSSKVLFYPMLKCSRRPYSQQVVPSLPLIDEMTDKVLSHPNKPNLERTAFIGVQHILGSTATLFKALIRLGANPQNMFFSGKCYSTSPLVAEEIRKKGIHLMPTKYPNEPGEYEATCKAGIKEMWNFCQNHIDPAKVDKIIILDEGGRCLEAMPKYIGFQYAIAGIEQTRGGLYNNRLDNLVLPLIEVASSAVKKKIEPPLIASAVLNRVKSVLPKLNLDKHTVCGVIGNGAIGYAIAKHLLSLGYYVAVYDDNPNAFAGIDSKKLRRMSSIATLIANTQCVFGCTGKDITQGVDVLNAIQGDTIFISCSSEDKEFLSLLKEINRHSIVMIDPLSDIVCRNQAKMRITILGGGYPINFDRSPISVPNHEIAVTRGLLLGACIQAASIASRLEDDGQTINSPSRHSLDPHLQNYVFHHWIKDQVTDKYSKELIENFNDPAWIRSHSGGNYYANPFLTECFSQKEQALNLFNNKVIAKIC